MVSVKDTSGVRCTYDQLVRGGLMRVVSARSGNGVEENEN
jgi:hypothetical protein